MTTPHTFILARLADDEQAARKVAPLGHVFDMGGKRLDERLYVSRLRYSSADGAARSEQDEAATDLFARHDPARVLDQCAALRAVVAAHRGWHVCPNADGEGYTDYGDGSGDEWEEVCPTLLALTAIWSTHADYDEGWAG